MWDLDSYLNSQEFFTSKVNLFHIDTFLLYEKNSSTLFRITVLLNGTHLPGSLLYSSESNLTLIPIVGFIEEEVYWEDTISMKHVGSIEEEVH